MAVEYSSLSISISHVSRIDHDMRDPSLGKEPGTRVGWACFEDAAALTFFHVPPLFTGLSYINVYSKT